MTAHIDRIIETLEANHEHHKEYDDHNGYPGSDLEAQNIAAIAVANALKARMSEPLGWLPEFAVKMLEVPVNQPDYVPWGLTLTIHRGEKPESVPIYSAPPAPAVRSVVLDKFDVAVAQEIVKVTELSFNSNAVCKEFAARLRKRIAADTSEPDDAPNLNDPSVRYRLATQWGFVRANTGS